MESGEAEDAIISVGKTPSIIRTDSLPKETKLAKYRFWSDKLRTVKHVVAPMVDQSELAFRMMMRAHNAHLCYSPMIHAQLFVSDCTYRKTALSTCETDRPLIIQFCANDPIVLLQACCLAEGFADGVDLNLGCPQLIAKRGHYGSYLQEDRDLVCSMVAAVHDKCRLPISCKIRVLDDINETINYARSLVEAGACMLTVHGRTRNQRGPHTGIADWGAIRQVCKSVDVPVIANGNIQIFSDIERCLEATGAAAVMSAEGVLSNPYLFEGKHKPNWVVAKEYLDYAVRYKANVSAIRAHLFRICHYSLLEYSDLRETLSYVSTIPDFRGVVVKIEERVTQSNPCFSIKVPLPTCFGNDCSLSTYISFFPHWVCKPYLRPQQDDSTMSLSIYRERRRAELNVLVEQTGLSKRQIRKREKRKIEYQKTQKRKQNYLKCLQCSIPASQSCRFLYCKNCCRSKTSKERLDCEGHHFQFSTKIPRCHQDDKAQESSTNEHLPVRGLKLFRCTFEGCAFYSVSEVGLKRHCKAKHPDNLESTEASFDVSTSSVKSGNLCMSKPTEFSIIVKYFSRNLEGLTF